MIIGILGGQEIILIILIVVLLFGVNKIPDIMRNIGKGANDINDATKDVKDTIDDLNIKKHLP